MQVQKIEHRSPGELKPRHREFRAHSPSQIDRLCGPIRTYGFNQAVAIDGANRIVCGAGLVAAAKKLEMNRIPVVVLDHLSDGELRAYAVAANELADLAGYDEMQLSYELADIRSLLDCDELPELAIDTPELDRLFDLANNVEDGEHEIPALPDGPSIVSSGDIWQMGCHRLLCGTALESASYHDLMGDERAQFCLTDVPYNLSTNTFLDDRSPRRFRPGGGRAERTRVRAVPDDRDASHGGLER